jgi:hypothetical protein
VLGFRWDVEGDKAARFAQVFYEGLLDKGAVVRVGLSQRLREAASRIKQRESGLAIPVMVVQTGGVAPRERAACSSSPGGLSTGRASMNSIIEQAQKMARLAEGAAARTTVGGDFLEPRYRR